MGNMDKNATAKAFTDFLTARKRRAEKFGNVAVFEDSLLSMKLTGQMNNRGKAMTQLDIKNKCYEWGLKNGKLKDYEKEGATKHCYFPAELVAVCLAVDEPAKCCGQQFKLQSDFWKRIVFTDDAIFFNPVLRRGLHRGNRVPELDDRYFDVCYLVSQRCDVNKERRLEQTVELCREKNASNYLTIDGYDININEYMEGFKRVCGKYGLRDVLYNTGNTGLIYDHSTNEYRPVIIDYAL